MLSVHPGDPLTLYRQIVEQVKGAIACGLLAPGDQLPTHRDLAQDLVVAPLTVKKAYDILEVEALVVSSRGRGTFVAENTGKPSPQAERDLEVRASGLVRQARLMRKDEEDLQGLVRRHWRKEGGGS